MKKEILIVLSVVLVVVIVACGLWLGYYAVDSQHQKQTYETLAEDFLLKEPAPSLSLEDNSSGESSAVGEPVVTLTTAPPRHDLAALQTENPDCVGWLTIPDTTVDYPIVWTPNDPEHYLRRLCQRWYTLSGWAKSGPGRGPKSHLLRPQYAGRLHVQAGASVPDTQLPGDP